MSNIRFAILPGIVFGGLVVFFLGNMIAGTEIVLASTEEAQSAAAVKSLQEPAAQDKQSVSQSSEDCSLSSKFSGKVLQWCGLIEEYSRQNNLEPALVAALITQESGGDPNAYSKSGAVGLMQVMPSDGLAAGFMCINGPCFASRPTMNELYDAEFNIRYGTGMLGGLVNKHGSIREALVAYGPANVGYYYADIVLKIYENYR